MCLVQTSKYLSTRDFTLLHKIRTDDLKCVVCSLGERLNFREINILTFAVWFISAKCDWGNFISTNSQVLALILMEHWYYIQQFFLMFFAFFRLNCESPHFLLDCFYKIFPFIREKLSIFRTFWNVSFDIFKQGFPRWMQYWLT